MGASDERLSSDVRLPVPIAATLGDGSVEVAIVEHRTEDDRLKLVDAGTGPGAASSKYATEHESGTFTVYPAESIASTGLTESGDPQISLHGVPGR